MLCLKIFFCFKNATVSFAALEPNAQSATTVQLASASRDSWEIHSPVVSVHRTSVRRKYHARTQAFASAVAASVAAKESSAALERCAIHSATSAFAILTSWVIPIFSVCHVSQLINTIIIIEFHPNKRQLIRTNCFFIRNLEEFELKIAYLVYQHFSTHQF